jgi:S1-C subfamily serine protease
MVVNPMLRRSILAAVLAVLGVSFGASAAHGQQPRSIKEHFAEAVGRANQSVVLVSTRPDLCESAAKTAPARPVFHNTGFFVSEDGAVLTTLLGVAGCGDIRVTYQPDESPPAQVQARVRAVDQAAGLALLECDLEDTEPLPVAASMPDPGAMLVLATRDERAALMVQPGLLMPRREDLRLNGMGWQDMPLTVLYVKPGAAAAPLLDARGRLCAVVLAVRARGDDLPDASLCYLLPADRLQTVVDDLKRGNSRRLGWLGLAVVEEPEYREGVKVAGVLEESPAHEVGIRPTDEILQVAGQVIESQQAFAGAVCSTEPGKKLPIKLRRGDRILNLEPRVAARPLLICSRPPRLPVAGRQKLPPAEALRRLAEENRRLRRELERLRKQGSRSAPPQ